MDDDNIYPPEMRDRPVIDDLSGRPISIRWKIAAVVAGVLLVVNSVSGNLNTILIRHTQTQNKPTITNTAALVEYVKDCTTPGGKCYQESQAQTAQVLGSVDAQNRAVTAAGAACSADLPQGLNYQQRYQRIHRCIHLIVDHKKSQ